MLFKKALRVLTVLSLIAGLHQPVLAANIKDYPTVAVMNFGNKAITSRGLREHDFSSATEYAIYQLSACGWFDLVDYEELSTIAKMHSVNMSGLIDPTTTVAMGKFAGAKFMVVGNVTGLTTKENIFGYQHADKGSISNAQHVVTANVAIRIVDIETGRIVVAGLGKGSSTSTMTELHFTKYRRNKVETETVSDTVTDDIIDEINKTTTSNKSSNRSQNTSKNKADNSDKSIEKSSTKTKDSSETNTKSNVKEGTTSKTKTSSNERNAETDKASSSGNTITGSTSSESTNQEQWSKNQSGLKTNDKTEEWNNSNDITENHTKSVGEDDLVYEDTDIKDNVKKESTKKTQGELSQNDTSEGYTKDSGTKNGSSSTSESQNTSSSSSNDSYKHTDTDTYSEGTTTTVTDSVTKNNTENETTLDSGNETITRKNETTETENWSENKDETVNEEIRKANNQNRVRTSNKSIAYERETLDYAVQIGTVVVSDIQVRNAISKAVRDAIYGKMGIMTTLNNGKPLKIKTGF